MTRAAPLRSTTLAAFAALTLAGCDAGAGLGPAVGAADAGGAAEPAAETTASAAAPADGAEAGAPAASEDDQRYRLAALVLAQCVQKAPDFRGALAATGMKAFGDGADGFDRYVDEPVKMLAGASDDVCVVTVAGEDLDRYAAGLGAVFGGRGADVRHEKAVAAWNSAFTIDDRAYSATTIPTRNVFGKVLETRLKREPKG